MYSSSINLQRCSNNIHRCPFATHALIICCYLHLVFVSWMHCTIKNAFCSSRAILWFGWCSIIVLMTDFILADRMAETEGETLKKHGIFCKPNCPHNHHPLLLAIFNYDREDIQKSIGVIEAEINKLEKLTLSQLEKLYNFTKQGKVRIYTESCWARTLQNLDMRLFSFYQWIYCACKYTWTHTLQLINSSLTYQPSPIVSAWKVLFLLWLYICRVFFKVHSTFEWCVDFSCLIKQIILSIAHVLLKSLSEGKLSKLIDLFGSIFSAFDSQV